MSERTPAEQNAVDRRRELIAEALDRAANGGVFLNAQGKPAPSLYNSRSGSSISAFNALMLALHSDQGGFQTNLYTPFTEARKRGEGVQAGERGVPFVWYNWNAFRDRSDKERIISRQEYNALSEEQKKGYAPVRDKEIRTLFNIEQTSLPLSDKAAFEKAVKEHGPASERGESEQDDKKLRMAVNEFLKAVSENLAPIRRDGIGIAHYDSGKDIIHLPSQEALRHLSRVCPGRCPSDRDGHRASRQTRTTGSGGRRLCAHGSTVPARTSCCGTGFRR